MNCPPQTKIEHTFFCNNIKLKLFYALLSQKCVSKSAIAYVIYLTNVAQTAYTIYLTFIFNQATVTAATKLELKHVRKVHLPKN